VKQLDTKSVTTAAVLMGLATCLPAAAKDISIDKVPSVIREIRTRYRMPDETSTTLLPMMPGAKVGTARDLADLVAIERKLYPPTVVTAGFYDWRTTSKYRSHAGLHFGYDIAMPYGQQFAAGWPGTITSIVVWSGEEHGITVQCPDGRTVTYGHVAPKCHVGQQVLPGMVLGTIARDHVDVKMRDAMGNFVDFGGDKKILPSADWATANPIQIAPAAPTREALMAQWLVANDNRDLAKQDLARFKVQSAQRENSLISLKRRLPSIKESQAMMQQYVDQGLVARVTAEENRQDLNQAASKLKTLKAAARLDTQQLSQLRKNFRNSENRLALAAKQARTQKIAWADVEAFVNRAVEKDAKLRHSVTEYKKNTRQKNDKRVALLRQQVTASAKSLKSLEELYEVGGISKNDLESAREKHHILSSQLRIVREDAGE
jgi:hypothetical protein